MRDGFISHSQAQQDLFVRACLPHRDGTFLDVGCQKPVENSNSYAFEQLGWKGVLIDIDPAMVEMCRKERTNPVILTDARVVDWGRLCRDYGLGTTLDYLSLDVDDYPGDEKTVKVLTHIIEAGLRFKVITVEHDSYRLGDLVRKPMRELLRSQGYLLARPNVYCGEPQYVFEDWWTGF